MPSSKFFLHFITSFPISSLAIGLIVWVTISEASGAMACKRNPTTELVRLIPKHIIITNGIYAYSTKDNIALDCWTETYPNSYTIEISRVKRDGNPDIDESIANCTSSNVAHSNPPEILCQGDPITVYISDLATTDSGCYWCTIKGVGSSEPITITVNEAEVEHSTHRQGALPTSSIVNTSSTKQVPTTAAKNGSRASPVGTFQLLLVVICITLALCK